jgi:hypothetical protein
MNKITKINYTFILILFSILLSIGYAKLNISNFDKNILIQKDNTYFHPMIKGDVYRYMSHGYEIKKDIKDGKNYFETGRQNFTKYLYPRVIALYYLIFDYDFFENKSKDIIKLGIHSNFLIFQILIYYSSVIFLYFQLKNILEKKILFFTLSFLSLEPTIFQFHGSFWSESIFFSIQVFLIGLILNNTQKNLRYFFIGVVLSILSLQRSNGFFYIVPILTYFYLTIGFSFTRKVIYVLTGFSILLLFVGYHNYKKSDEFYIFPAELNAVLHTYVVPNILSEKDLLKEKNKTIKFLKSKDLDLDYEHLKTRNYLKFAFDFCEADVKIEKRNNDLYFACEYLQKQSYKLIISNPLLTIKFVAKKSISFVILNPFSIYSDNRCFIDSCYDQDNHRKLIPYRILYSILIYSICLFGFIKIFRAQNKNILLFTLLSSFYFFSILSWHGNNRYFVSSLIYFSFYFGYGMNQLLSFFNKKSI